MTDRLVRKCFFTDLPTELIKLEPTLIEYNVFIGDKKHLIRINGSAVNWGGVRFYEDNKYIFQSLLYNDNWIENEKTLITFEVLQNLLKEKSYPKTPQQKLENLFLFLSKLPGYDGEGKLLGKDFIENVFWKKLFFKEKYESYFYIDALKNEGLIIYNTNSDGSFTIRLTYDGLNKAIQLQEEGELSNKCFVAMSFDKSTKEIRQAIKDAVTETGFEAVLIDEKDIDSGTTINDAIIANLKKCKFCIADFTGQSKGVYFESGFALGQGKKVIYCCRKDDFERAHFDIKPLQHIIYETAEELKRDLVHKIEAWVK
jgi:hypothetical protein